MRKKIGFIIFIYLVSMFAIGFSPSYISGVNPSTQVYWSDGTSGSASYPNLHWIDDATRYIALFDDPYTSYFADFLEFKYGYSKFTGTVSSFNVYVASDDSSKWEFATDDNTTLYVNGELIGKPTSATNLTGLNAGITKVNWACDVDIYDEYPLFEIRVNKSQDWYALWFIGNDYNPYCGYQNQRMHKLFTQHGNGYLDGFTIDPLRDYVVMYTFAIQYTGVDLDWTFHCNYDDVGNDFEINNTIDYLIEVDPAINYGMVAMGNDNDQIYYSRRIDLHSGIAQVKDVYIGHIEDSGDHKIAVVNLEDYLSNSLISTNDIDDWNIYGAYNNFYNFTVVYGDEIEGNYSIDIELPLAYVGDTQTLYISTTITEDLYVEVIGADGSLIYNSSLVTFTGGHVREFSYVIPHLSSPTDMYQTVRLYDSSHNLITQESATSQYLVMYSGIAGYSFDFTPKTIYDVDSSGNYREVNILGHHDFKGQEALIVIYRLDISNIKTLVEVIDISDNFNFGDDPDIKFIPKEKGNYSLEFFLNGFRYDDVERILVVRSYEYQAPDYEVFPELPNYAKYIGGLVCTGMFGMLPLFFSIGFSHKQIQIPSILYVLFVCIGVVASILFGFFDTWVLYFIAGVGIIVLGIMYYVGQGKSQGA